MTILLTTLLLYLKYFVLQSSLCNITIIHTKSQGDLLQQAPSGISPTRDGQFNSVSNIPREVTENIIDLFGEDSMMCENETEFLAFEWVTIAYCAASIIDDQPHALSGRSTDETNR